MESRRTLQWLRATDRPCRARRVAHARQIEAARTGDPHQEQSVVRHVRVDLFLNLEDEVVDAVVN